MEDIEKKMGMPKGSKVQQGYATVPTGVGANYRKIGREMTRLGYKMNHASARNYVLRIMQKFARAISDLNDTDVQQCNLENIARDPGFQNVVGDMVRDIIDARKQ